MTDWYACNAYKMLLYVKWYWRTNNVGVKIIKKKYNKMLRSIGQIIKQSNRFKAGMSSTELALSLIWSGITRMDIPI